MKKALPLLFLLLSSAFAFTQTTTQFTNGPSSNACPQANYPGTYYCVSMHRYDASGVWLGYLAFWLHLNPDGKTFQSGDVYMEDTTGAAIFTATDFAGTFDGTNFDGTFSANSGSITGKLHQVMGPRKVCAGKYGCHWSTADTGGSGSYTTQ